MDVAHQPTQEERGQRARHLAAMRFQNANDWVTFYREVLGVDGVVHQLFPTFEQRTAFEKTESYAEIQQMLAKLRERRGSQAQPDEPTRVITVRLPQSLHEFLRHEAHNHRTSMNKLCISKLLQVVADELVPSDFQRREELPPVVPMQPPAERVSSEVAPPAREHSLGTPRHTMASPTPSVESDPGYPRPSAPGGRPF
jgi:predicted HicB family RNase H-like nuclease